MQTIAQSAESPCGWSLPGQLEMPRARLAAACFGFLVQARWTSNRARNFRDLNSTNGVKVNGIRVTERVLILGDLISIAKKTYTIEYARPPG
jgi:hypothetical protein